VPSAAQQPEQEFTTPSVDVVIIEIVLVVIIFVVIIKLLPSSWVSRNV
jgi:hypothetical protein